MEWDREQCLELIQLYKLKPELWDTKHKLYHMKTKKQDALNDIAKNFNTTSDIIKTKLNSLTTSFRRERGKERSSFGTGTGRDQVYKSQWFAYEAFEFLMDKNKCRKSVNTIAQKENDELQEQHLEVSGDSENSKTDQSSEQVTIIGDEFDANNSLLEDLNSKEQTSTTDETRIDTPTIKKSCNKRKLCTNNNTSINEDPRIATAFNIMQSCVQQRDSCDIYGEHVAIKLRTYSKRTQNMVQHVFNNILFKADMGEYDQEEFCGLNFRTSNSTPFSPPSSRLSNHQYQFDSRTTTPVLSPPQYSIPHTENSFQPSTSQSSAENTSDLQPRSIAETTANYFINFKPSELPENFTEL